MPIEFGFVFIGAGIGVGIALAVAVWFEDRNSPTRSCAQTIGHEKSPGLAGLDSVVGA